MPKVLISDELHDAAAQIFRERGVEVDFQPQLGKDKAKLAESSATTTASPSARPPRSPGDPRRRPTNLKVIGRAGIGVDNVDIPAASAKGVVVMNTPSATRSPPPSTRSR